MPDLTRRRLLGSAAGAIGGAAALTLLPPSIQQAVAAGPATHGSLDDIEHVVLLMQENRSFDHYFGTMKGVRGFADPDALTLSTGSPRDCPTTPPSSSPRPSGRSRTSRSRPCRVPTRLLRCRSAAGAGAADSSYGTHGTCVRAALQEGGPYLRMLTRRRTSACR